MVSTRCCFSETPIGSTRRIVLNRFWSRLQEKWPCLLALSSSGWRNSGAQLVSGLISELARVEGEDWCGESQGWSCMPDFLEASTGAACLEGQHKDVEGMPDQREDWMTRRCISGVLHCHPELNTAISISFPDFLIFGEMELGDSSAFILLADIGGFQACSLSRVEPSTLSRGGLPASEFQIVLPSQAPLPVPSPGSQYCFDGWLLPICSLTECLSTLCSASWNPLLCYF